MRRWGRSVRLFELVQGLDIHLLLIMDPFGESKVHVVGVAQSIPTFGHSMDCSQPGSSVHGDSPGKNTRVGCHALLQGIFPTHGLTQVSCNR